MTATSTLLIVDDTPENIEVLFDDLVTAGYQVLVCESGQAALDTLAHEEPDLILLDVMMPGIDGFETCRRLKQLPAGRDVPVFFMTALNDPFDKVRGIEAGAVDYVTKPVYPDELVARIRVHLEIRRLQKELQEQNDRLDAARQRSIVAEQALSQSLGRAVVVLQRGTGEILFLTRQAADMLERHGGVTALTQWLADGNDIVATADGRRLHLRRNSATASSDRTELITLEEEAPPPSTDDLRPLGLTPRETEILFWVTQGKTNPEIAVILNMQVCTVKKHVENFLPKLGVETRLAAALLAQEHLGWRQGR